MMIKIVYDLICADHKHHKNLRSVFKIVYKHFSVP